MHRIIYIGWYVYDDKYKMIFMGWYVLDDPICIGGYFSGITLTEVGLTTHLKMISGLRTSSTIG